MLYERQRTGDVKSPILSVWDSRPPPLKCQRQLHDRRCQNQHGDVTEQLPVGNWIILDHRIEFRAESAN